MADSLALTHWNISDPLPRKDDAKFDGALEERLRATHENFEELVTQAARQLAGAIQQRVPPGVISMYGATTAPTGYLLCDGAAVSRTTYVDLFGVIGTTFGAGDGSTTFNVPNYSGSNRFPRGAATPGGTGGATTHTHTLSASTDARWRAAPGTPADKAHNDADHVHPVSTDSNVPPYLDTVFIIKT